MALIPRRVTPRMIAANRLNKLKPGDARALGARKKAKSNNHFLSPETVKPLKTQEGARKRTPFEAKTNWQRTAPRAGTMESEG